VTQHDLKVWPPYFDPLADGRKPFEVRRDDRPFAVGDELILREWLPVAGIGPLSERGRYTGRALLRRVTYVLRGADAQAFGVAPGFAVLGLGGQGGPPWTPSPTGADPATPHPASGAPGADPTASASPDTPTPSG
jgi:hypothetical protein